MLSGSGTSRATRASATHHLRDATDIGDKIDLSSIDADVIQPGDQDFEFGVNLWTVDSGSNTIVRADVNLDGLADFEVTVEDGIQTAFFWDERDFVL